MKKITPTRGIIAKELLKNSEYSVIKNQVDELITSIDAAIEKAHSSGFNSTRYPLPTNLGANNLSKADAQVLAYSEILMIYKEPPPVGKGFDDVTIDGGETPTLCIRWVNGMDETEKAERKRYIANCMKQTPVKK
jgi:hypothetical protein